MKRLRSMGRIFAALCLGLVLLMGVTVPAMARSRFTYCTASIYLRYQNSDGSYGAYKKYCNMTGSAGTQSTPIKIAETNVYKGLTIRFTYPNSESATMYYSVDRHVVSSVKSKQSEVSAQIIARVNTRWFGTCYQSLWKGKLKPNTRYSYQLPNSTLYWPMKYYFTTGSGSSQVFYVSPSSKF